MYDYICIDFETANDMMNSACSVGIAAVSGHEIVNTFYSLIKPPYEYFNPQNTEIHHLTPEDVKDSPTFDGLIPTIIQYIQNSHIVVAHNAQFDMSVLSEAATFYNCQVPDFWYMDSLRLTIDLECKHHSLDGLADYFHIDISDHHNSLSDAITLAKIVTEYLKMVHRSLFSCVCNLEYVGNIIKAFSDLKPNRRFITRKKKDNSKERLVNGISDDNPSIGNNCIPYYRINPKTIIGDESKIDKTHVLYGKKCVFTGELHMITRADAIKKVKDIGGLVIGSVSSKTNYLILGEQDKTLVGSDGMSSKERKAKQLIAQGVSITILNEQEFLSLFQSDEEKLG